jgi:16S rRNA (guanine966-N2)-methyltransferase
VLDLYCGTGALAIEALSRGAARATLVDQRTSLAIANASELGISERCEVVRADALQFLRRDRRQWGLIFCDPPYRLADRLQATLENLIPARLAEGGLLVAESAARRPLALDLPLVDERTYGETHIGVYSAGARDA